jgi:phosphoglycolate phosphatase
MDVVLFDIDGTLIHSAGAGRSALDRALSQEFGHPSTAAIELHGRTDRGIARNIFRQFAIEETEENWNRFRTAYLAALPECLAERPGTVLPGVFELLEHLAARPGTAIGLLTGNVREGARLKLGHYGVEVPFDIGGFGDRHHERDDVAREAWAAVRQELGERVRADRVWVIGDTPHDVTCARAINAKVVAVCTGGFSVTELASSQPDFLVDDLTQVEPLLAALDATAA